MEIMMRREQRIGSPMSGSNKQYNISLLAYNLLTIRNGNYDEERTTNWIAN